MWIPRPIYEALPYAYMAGGIALLGAAYFLEQGPRGWLLAAGAGVLTVGWCCGCGAGTTARPRGV